MSEEQTITQLEWRQCRWDRTKLYKSSHTLVARLQLLPLRSVRPDWTHRQENTNCKKKIRKEKKKPQSLGLYQYCLTQ